MKIFPNPTDKEIKAVFNSKEGFALLRLISSIGIELFSKEIQVEEGINSCILNLNEFPSGIYILALEQNDFIRSVKVIIAH
jgi:hypothetical protein